MTHVVSDKIVCARKPHRCHASDWWDNLGMALTDCQTDDQRQIVQAAQADKWRILPGQSYRKIVYVEDGAVRTYRARVGMDSVCRELDLFDAQ